IDAQALQFPCFPLALRSRRSKNTPSVIWSDGSLPLSLRNLANACREGEFAGPKFLPAHPTISRARFISLSDILASYGPMTELGSRGVGGGGGTKGVSGAFTSRMIPGRAGVVVLTTRFFLAAAESPLITSLVLKLMLASIEIGMQMRK